MPVTQVTIPRGETTPVVTNSGSGTTQAADLPEIAPNADAFVCVTTRPQVPIRQAGFRVRISTAGTYNDGIGGDTSTAVGTLKVRDSDAGVDLTDPVTVFDHPNTQNPAVGTVLRLGKNSKDALAPTGNRVDLIYNETGAINTGTRPKFQFLGWGPIPTADEVL